jgi:phosphomannomutase
MLVEVLQGLGAEVIAAGRSDKFIPIDTENVTLDDRIYFAMLAKENPGVFAIVSTDGDSDRPFVIDEHGVFHRGDELGAVVAKWLSADYAAILVSSSDAVDTYLSDGKIGFMHTKIGSPHVIAAMEEAMAAGKSRVVGWEVNGGFLLGTDMEVEGKVLKRLPTRDAFLPILIALAIAQQEATSVSKIFTGLPARFTQAGLIDNYPVETSKAIVAKFSEDTPENRAVLSRYFSSELGFGAIEKVNSLDGIRMFFGNGDIAHLRPSGNAPQMRIYSVADSQERADAIVQLGIAADGILEQLKASISA